MQLSYSFPNSLPNTPVSIGAADTTSTRHGLLADRLELEEINSVFVRPGQGKWGLQIVLFD
jgi:hypothetical protein